MRKMPSVLAQFNFCGPPAVGIERGVAIPPHPMDNSESLRRISFIYPSGCAESVKATMTSVITNPRSPLWSVFLISFPLNKAIFVVISLVIKYRQLLFYQFLHWNA